MSQGFVALFIPRTRVRARTVVNALELTERSGDAWSGPAEQRLEKQLPFSNTKAARSTD